LAGHHQGFRRTPALAERGGERVELFHRNAPVDPALRQQYRDLDAVHLPGGRVLDQRGLVGTEHARQVSTSGAAGGDVAFLEHHLQVVDADVADGALVGVGIPDRVHQCGVATEACTVDAHARRVGQLLVDRPADAVGDVVLDAPAPFAVAGLDELLSTPAG